MSRVPNRRRAARATTVLAALTALAASAPAQAARAPDIGPDRIVVHDDEGARAVISRAPFRIVFEDARGREVLGEVPGSLPQPTNANTEPGGVDAVPELAAYGPLAFEVGGERNLQHPGGLYTGNQVAGARGGVTHLATRVERADPEAGGGVALVVATTDPSRKLNVRVSPDGGSSLRVQAGLSVDTGVTSFTASFGSQPGEAFRGFGGKHNYLDQRGQDFYNWVEEESIGAREFQPVFSPLPGSGGDRYQAPNGQSTGYYIQNIFVSSRPYGFLLNETALTRWRMAADRQDAWQVTASDADLDYTVAVGDAPDAIRSITEISGRHRVSPDWALGPMVKRNIKQGDDSPAKQMEKITKDLDTIERLKVSLDAYVYESWDTLPRDWVRRTNERIRRMGMRPVGYVRAYVNDEGNFDPPGTLQEAIDAGAAVQTPAGTPFISVAVGPAILIDFTSPRAVAWWERRKIRPMLDLGFEGFMQDFGEQVNDDMRFAGGQDPTEMHNLYPVIYHQATRRILDAYEREHPGRGPFWMYTRTGFSGRPGSAAVESANFPGDETSDYQRSMGLPSLATDMLNRQVGGLFGYTTDIGGYFDQFGAQRLDAELFSRWSAWAALTPHFRLHNSSGEGTKMPWDFDEATLGHWRKFSALHVTARPYIKRLWEQAVRTGMPIVRPLWLHHPDDPKAAEQDQQWLLGEDVLVAPVVAKGASGREVYFPAGCWQHGETGQRYEGRRSATVPAALDSLPYFIRCGTAPFATAAADLGLRKRSCRSRRAFTIRLKRPSGTRLKSARVYVNGKRVRVLRGKRLRAPVVLTGLPKGRYTVRIVARTTSGRRVVDQRRYRTCVPGPKDKRKRKRSGRR